MTFTGAWLTRSQVDPQIPLVQPIDVQHLNPDPNPQFQQMTPDWVNSAPAPDLPEALWPALPPMLETGNGPVSGINYNDTQYGTGFGHGLTELQSQDIAAGYNLTDDGSVAAEGYQPAVNRQGTYHASFVPDVRVQQDSPQTTALQRYGVGVPNDPYARPGQRLERWYDGPIDMHRWDVTFRPLRPKYARTPTVQETPNANQNSIHTPSSIGYLPTPPDRFVTPMARRVPGDWQTPFTFDGTGDNLGGVVGAYGLRSW